MFKQIAPPDIIVSGTSHGGSSYGRRIMHMLLDGDFMRLKVIEVTPVLSQDNVIRTLYTIIAEHEQLLQKATGVEYRLPIRVQREQQPGVPAWV